MSSGASFQIMSLTQRDWMVHRGAAVFRHEHVHRDTEVLAQRRGFTSGWCLHSLEGGRKQGFYCDGSHFLRSLKNNVTPEGCRTTPGYFRSNYLRYVAMAIYAASLNCFELQSYEYSAVMISQLISIYGYLSH